MSAIAAPTGTSSPTVAISLRTSPGLSASSVPVIFSVSMSARSSPGATGSPSATTQSVILPDRIDRPHFGMATEVMPESVIAATPRRA